MAKTPFYSHNRPESLALLLRYAYVSKELGILTLKRNDFSDWFWLGEGYVSFAWHEGSFDHLFDHLNRSGLVPFEILAEQSIHHERTNPAGFLEALPLSLKEDSRWDQFWLEYYSRRLAVHLESLRDTEILWNPVDWTIHPSMIIVDIPTWIEDALKRVKNTSALKQMLNRADLQAVSGQLSDTATNPLSSRILNRCLNPMRMDHLLESLEDDDLIKHLWFMIWNGRIALKRITPAPQTSLETILDRLIFYYDQSFRWIYDYLTRELQDLAEPIFIKNFTHVASSYPGLLSSLVPEKSGGINSWKHSFLTFVHDHPDQIELINQALEEVMMLHLLSVQNILGREHYTTLVEMIKTLHRQDIPPLGSSRATAGGKT